MKTKILVSACLLGENCKYNGGNNKNEDIISLGEIFELIPVCPECFAGLPVPRLPSEINNGRVYSKAGEDLTSKFRYGAEQTLYIARECNAPAAVLKERSPSCGFGEIYDGTFTGKLCKGSGFTAELLDISGIAVFGESNIKKLINLYS